MSCVEALEQGAHAVYELELFHPMLLPSLPPGTTATTIATWLVEAAGLIRADLRSNHAATDISAQGIATTGEE